MAEAIEAEHYRAVRRKLLDDPVVIEMAREAQDHYRTNRSEFVHPNGHPRHELMGRANEEYRKRGGTITDKHIGAVAEALVLTWEDDEAEGRARAAEGV